MCSTACERHRTSSVSGKPDDCSSGKVEKDRSVEAGGVENQTEEEGYKIIRSETGDSEGERGGCEIWSERDGQSTSERETERERHTFLREPESESVS